MNPPFADKIQMQHRLFAELSRMFGQEVPLYDKSLLVNKVCNETVGALLAQKYSGFQLSAEQLDKTSGERHGAIRIGKPSEYRWVAGFFAAFALEPHNYYDMTRVGSKSQPIVATAFRSSLNPEHRVFTSLLMTNYFDPQTQQRIATLLAPRDVFSTRAKTLIIKNQEQGGLNWSEAEELIQEGVNRIFKWTGKARDHQLYQELSNAGFKIAADIACFASHHLNHLTPNTLCMDLYTAAMKFCLGEINETTFRSRAAHALQRLSLCADSDYLKLHFKHLSRQNIDAFAQQEMSEKALVNLTEKLTQRLQAADLDLRQLKHSGFKDTTEGPSEDTPILLRQDSYKALTEPVVFQQADGSTVETVHTARFGEIEQRFYATTPAGRELYDQCLAAAETLKSKKPGWLQQNPTAYLDAYAQCFAPFPKKLAELLRKKLVYGHYTVTEKGLAAQKRHPINTTDLSELIQLGYVQAEGLRYEDFLPVSAAGIFASNLGQYGTQSTAAEKPTYSQTMLEDILGRKIIDANAIYHHQQSASLWNVYTQLGLLDKLPPSEKTELEQAMAVGTSFHNPGSSTK